MSVESTMDDRDQPKARAFPDLGDSRRRAVMLVWMVGASIVTNLLTIVLNLVLYYHSTRAWQNLVASASSLLAIGALLMAGRAARRSRLEAAGYLLLVSMALAYGGPHLLFGGASAYVLGCVALVTFVGGNIALPRRWRVLGLMFAAFAMYVLIVDAWDPPFRYVPAEPSILTPIAWLSGAAVYLGLLVWQVVQAFSAGTIRARLVASFVLIVLVPVAAIGGTLFAVGVRNGQRQAVNQLEAIVRIKATEVEDWVTGLHAAMDDAMGGGALSAVVLGRLRDISEEGTLVLINTYRSYLLQAAERSPWIAEMALLDRDGRVLLSTDLQREGVDESAEQYFVAGLEGFYMEPLVSAAMQGHSTMAIARPIAGPSGDAIAVLAGRVDPSGLSEILGERTWLGETGEAFMMDGDGILLTPHRFADGFQPVLVDTAVAREAIETQDSGFLQYSDYRSERAFGVYQWLPDLQIALIAKQDQAEALRATYAGLRVTGYVAAGVLALAVVVSLVMARGISTPLSSLTAVSARIAHGELDLTATVTRHDEIGELAESFNSMTAQLRGLVSGLEERVAERTRDLERYSAYLLASAEVGRAASSILDPEELTRQIVELIRERFDLYYVGLFIVSESRQWAVLRAGTGNAGKDMVARGHRIRVGQGMVGWCIENAEARVALDVGEDAIRLRTAELPDTRSEAALPLRSRGQVAGALTVQDDRPGTFVGETLVALQIMADQVAVALDNARLFSESQRAFEAQRRVYGEISKRAWAHLAREQSWSYRASDQGVFRLDGRSRLEARQEVPAEGVVVTESESGATATVPIPVRGYDIGTLAFRKQDGNEGWSDQEIALLEALAEQLGDALESARLYRDTQRRAEREQLVGELSSHMRQTLDVESVLRTAVQEVREALGVPEVVVRLRGQRATDVDAGTV